MMIRRWTIKDKNDYRRIYSERENIFGEEIVKMIHKHYKGEQINLGIKRILA